MCMSSPHSMKQKAGVSRTFSALRGDRIVGDLSLLPIPEATYSRKPALIPLEGVQLLSLSETAVSQEAHFSLAAWPSTT